MPVMSSGAEGGVETSPNKVAFLGRYLRSASLREAPVDMTRWELLRLPIPLSQFFVKEIKGALPGQGSGFLVVTGRRIVVEAVVHFWIKMGCVFLVVLL